MPSTPAPILPHPIRPSAIGAAPIRPAFIRLGLALGLALSAGCSDGRLAPLDAAAAAAPGVDRRSEPVDGLTVGHRLMDAGEYDLALSEYYRAAAERGLTADVLAAIGSANLQLGRLGQAERLLRQSIALDERNPTVWNNLGVVLMERGETGEAARTFRTAFALDSGESADIRENLRTALARLENPAYTAEQNNNYTLVRPTSGTYRIVSAP